MEKISFSLAMSNIELGIYEGWRTFLQCRHGYVEEKGRMSLTEDKKDNHKG